MFLILTILYCSCTGQCNVRDNKQPEIYVGRGSLWYPFYHDPLKKDPVVEIGCARYSGFSMTLRKQLTSETLLPRVSMELFISVKRTYFIVILIRLIKYIHVWSKKRV